MNQPGVSPEAKPVSDGPLSGWSEISLLPPLLSSGRVAGVYQPAWGSPFECTPSQEVPWCLRGRLFLQQPPLDLSAPGEPELAFVWMLEGDTLGQCELILQSFEQIQLNFSEFVIVPDHLFWYSA